MIYIASRYRERETNRAIERELRAGGFDTFLPEHLGIEAYGPNEKRSVAIVCEQAIRDCSTMVVVAPYGHDVSFEIGYGVAHAEAVGMTRPIVLFDPFGRRTVDNDDMIAPHVDCVVSSTKELVQKLKWLENLGGETSMKEDAGSRNGDL